MESGRVKTLVASLVLAGAGWYLYSHLRVRPPSPEPLVHEGIGLVLAEQVAKLAGGGRITLIVRDTSVFPNPATGLQLKGFHEGLKKTGLRVVATNLAKLDPGRPVRVPPGDFFEILRRQNDGDVVVSFLGPPLLDATRKTQLGQKTVRVVAFCPGEIPRQTDLRALFELDLVHAAIISRLDPSLVTPQSKDPMAWFRHYYHVVTLANLADLPLPDANGRR